MEISNYISSLSMQMGNTRFQQSVSMAVMDLAMDAQNIQAEAVKEILQLPSFGHELDIRV